MGSSEPFQYVSYELSLFDLEEEEDEDTKALMELEKLEEGSSSDTADEEDNVCIFIFFFTLK